MANVDAFLCNHAAGLCEAYMPFNRSLVVIASTRYEIGRHEPSRWREWNANLVKIASHPRNVVAANNRFDAEYIKYFTGIQNVPVFPNYCGYTGVTYKPTRPQFLVGPGRGISDLLLKQLLAAAARTPGAPEFKRIRDLCVCAHAAHARARAEATSLCLHLVRASPLTRPPFFARRYNHFEYSDLAAHPAIVLLPYQISLMSIFEYYRMNIPMYAPTPRLLASWQVKHRVLNELTWDLVFKKAARGSPLPRHPSVPASVPDPNDQANEAGLAYWLKFADFYEWPHIDTFDSWDELLTKIKAADLNAVSAKMAAHNTQMKDGLLGDWNAAFHRMFNGVPPARTKPRPLQPNFDVAMKENYGTVVAPGCNG